MQHLLDEEGTTFAVRPHPNNKSLRNLTQEEKEMLWSIDENLV